ncbi:LacI family DNA-binding transcriptional regulator [Bartonella sp. HY329]|uniref:LacI family DNA-binding transcriptional regulator n=1 Tax=unclassified Bartonella TaxID=2645622 RepID=UPI0021C6D42B|nr:MULTISPECIES: LacI family DNA-binding transcriptional regulator [unclassified Bartonella]UXM94438.1 LacI family DNA-binding transcriptional regulator [Bartonella sp. HY329]UXN08762.1 LacI family DNA-binding transcriptional regulator [Bartonella sp. HY328]
MNEKSKKTPFISRQPTANDVARLANVSQSAVSRCYTKGASISPQTRERVMDAARQLGYRPNLVARSLITRQSKVIGVIIPSLENPFYTTILETLSDNLAEKGYRILLFPFRQGASSDPLIDEVLNHRVDAIILVSSNLSSTFADECSSIGLPVVQLNRRSERSHVSSVTGDNETGARLIAEFLIAGDHKKIAYMAGLETASTNKQRETAFTERLKQSGIKLHARIAANYNFEEAKHAARRFFSMQDRPDAIFCANDHMAIATLSVAKYEFSLIPGSDVSIIGFDDMRIADWPQYRLTTYQQPAMSMAKRAIDIILDQLNNNMTETINDIIGGELIIRNSARIPKP